MNIHELNAIVNSFNRDTHRFLAANAVPNHINQKMAVLVTQDTNQNLLIGYFTEKQVQQCSDKWGGVGEAYVNAFKAIKNPEKEFLFFAPCKDPAIISKEDWLKVIEHLQQEHQEHIDRN